LISIIVDASLHIDLDKYDLFALTAAQETRKNLKAYLEQDLAHRQKIVNSGGLAVERLYEVGFSFTLPT
jgi:hypothetical protein